MKRIIKVDSCLECQHYYEGGDWRNVCGAKDRKIKTMRWIPRWCPLEPAAPRFREDDMDTPNDMAGVYTEAVMLKIKTHLIPDTDGQATHYNRVYEAVYEALCQMECQMEE